MLKIEKALMYAFYAAMVFASWNSAVVCSVLLWRML